MSAPKDFVQHLREAIVTHVDSHPEIVAITGRPAENIVAWRNLGAVALPVIAYFVVSATEVAADGDTRRAVVQMTAAAESEAEANELIGAVERAFHLSSLIKPPLIDVDGLSLDAIVERRSRRAIPFDADEEAARADLDLTFRVYRTPAVPLI